MPMDVSFQQKNTKKLREVFHGQGQALEDQVYKEAESKVDLGMDGFDSEHQLDMCNDFQLPHSCSCP